MNVYKITHNPSSHTTMVLADSLEEAVKIFLDTRTCELEKRIFQVETIARDVIYKTDDTKIQEIKEQIKDALVDIVSTDIEEYIDNM